MQENAQLCAKKRGNGQEDHFGAPKSALIGVEGDVVGCMVVCHGTSPSKVESKVHYFSVGGGYGGPGGDARAGDDEGGRKGAVGLKLNAGSWRAPHSPVLPSTFTFTLLANPHNTAASSPHNSDSRNLRAISQQHTFVMTLQSQT